MTPLFPLHTPSKSLADRLYNAEFDDALVDQLFWKNSRYEGCKIISKEINKYTPTQTASNDETGIGFASIVTIGGTIGSMEIGGMGFNSFTVGGPYADLQTIGSGYPVPQNLSGIFQINNFIPSVTWPGDTMNPAGLSGILKNQTTALYLSNTVIGGKEDPQFATLENHSYIGINQILLVNINNDEVQLIDKQTEDYVPFHQFITNDLKTGGSFSLKVIDPSISHNLQGPNQYKVKMNKGWLLKSFDFKFFDTSEQLTENNSIYVYKGGTQKDNFYTQGYNDTDGSHPGYTTSTNNDRIRFRYGTIEMHAGAFTPFGHYLSRYNIGPSFASSSILSNKFTDQYYSGRFGLINEPDLSTITGRNGNLVAASGLGSASVFIGLNSLEFLASNNSNSTLTEQEKTELHVTFLQGTKDFAPGFNDERSIGTFEIDRNQEQLDIGDVCNNYLPKTHEVVFKGLNDDRFIPKLSTHEDDLLNAYVTGSNTDGDSLGCININQLTPSLANTTIQRGINADYTENTSVYVQGGILGDIGYESVQSASAGALYGRPLTGSNSDQYYSGSGLNYQLSFLDKDHTIITNLDKENELFNGIGNSGILIIPENIHPRIRNNISFYLQQAGIITSSPNTFTHLSSDSQ